LPLLGDAVPAKVRGNAAAPHVSESKPIVVWKIWAPLSRSIGLVSGAQAIPGKNEWISPLIRRHWALLLDLYLDGGKLALTEGLEVSAATHR
jgi:hypothetical protein